METREDTVELCSYSVLWTVDPGSGVGTGAGKMRGRARGVSERTRESGREGDVRIFT